MGVDLVDCVKAQWPEHSDHKVSLLPSLAHKSFAAAATTEYFAWTCECGAEGKLTGDQVGALLRANAVVTF